MPRGAEPDNHDSSRWPQSVAATRRDRLGHRLMKTDALHMNCRGIFTSMLRPGGSPRCSKTLPFSSFMSLG
eukprot:2946103-Alexandrium_andersonii.AAC.1